MSEEKPGAFILARLSSVSLPWVTGTSPQCRRDCTCVLPHFYTLVKKEGIEKQNTIPYA